MEPLARHQAGALGEDPARQSGAVEAGGGPGARGWVVGLLTSEVCADRYELPNTLIQGDVVFLLIPNQMKCRRPHAGGQCV